MFRPGDRVRLAPHIFAEAKQKLTGGTPARQALEALRRHYIRGGEFRGGLGNTVMVKWDGDEQISEVVSSNLIQADHFEIGERVKYRPEFVDRVMNQPGMLPVHGEIRNIHCLMVGSGQCVFTYEILWVFNNRSSQWSWFTSGQVLQLVDA